MRPQRTFAALSLALLSAVGCTSARDAEHGRLIVYTAGSLARPIRAALDSFVATANVEVDLESAGSLETARKLTELGKIPDVIALADEEVFPKLLMPQFTTWYARFARNRMVIAFSDRSRYASELSAQNWRDVLTRRDVEIGRANPNLDPAGYRALLVMQLAERHYRDPGLAARLEASATKRNMRAKEAELVALVQAGEQDYSWQYESLARAVGLRYLTLPPAIDLSSDGDSATYATASVRVVGGAPGDSITMIGRAIRYAVSIPTDAPHHELAQQFVAWLLSAPGRATLRAEHLDALDDAQFTGTGVPHAVRFP
ncbi:MAG TPA: extracellular solute-binding protein [Gemmatimonadaceae bacterium]|jgi:molybdate/tungstate transport system substrate-binding protein